ncbi:MAG: TIM barrel protein [Rhodospirillaceae bacterium]|nr:TIM barrel protein [Rhodospirillaceae bacterium]
MKFAPHPGMFEGVTGDDYMAQLEFAAEQGFHAWEDNGFADRDVAEQERYGQGMADLGMTMGVFVASGNLEEVTLASGDSTQLEGFLADITQAVDVARRANATWMTVVPGAYDLRLPHGYQMANVVEGLRRGAGILEPHGLVMVLEPLNRLTNHPRAFLTHIHQAYELCVAVDSPACKILFDMYHQQITEGNIIPNIDRAWERIGYFQIGDNPGRGAPTTGEMNYRNIFEHIKAKDENVVLGMEHLPWTSTSEQQVWDVIDAYRRVDPS